jgi:hypothetical protein
LFRRPPNLPTAVFALFTFSLPAGMQLIYLVVIGDILVGTDGAEGLLSQECGDRRTVLAVVTVLLLAPMVSAT